MNEIQPTCSREARTLPDGVTAVAWSVWQLALLGLALAVGVVIEVVAELRSF